VGVVWMTKHGLAILGGKMNIKFLIKTTNLKMLFEAVNTRKEGTEWRMKVFHIIGCGMMFMHEEISLVVMREDPGRKGQALASIGLWILLITRGCMRRSIKKTQGRTKNLMVEIMALWALPEETKKTRVVTVMKWYFSRLALEKIMKWRSSR
jgi:hypothetical protein